jgi:hypothetical protein
LSTRRKPQPGRRRVGAVAGTGIQFEAAHRHHARIAPTPSGQHLWAVFAVFRIADPGADQHHLDAENLLTIEGPACFACEQVHTPQRAASPCTGDPSQPRER